jgi:nifR3 family TIM-barrel protein
MNNFWEKLKKKKKPIYALAPLAGVTDSAFRQTCKSFGADVLYSEMASTTALFYLQKKKENFTLDLLEFDKKERPYVVQLFGSNPKHFEVATKIISSHPLCVSPSGRGRNLRPDGIDINFGCPVPKVAKQKAGAELFKDKKLSREVIKSVIENTDLPVSIKIRTKVGNVDILQFLDYIKDLDIKALMIHGRTFAQGFAGPIDTKAIKQARNYFGGVILANGGINDSGEAERVLRETEVDGLGIARGAMGNPWIFKELKKTLSLRGGAQATTRQSRVFLPAGRQGFAIARNDMKKTILKHAKLAEKLKGEQGIVEMRKHLCWYVQGLPGAKRLREKLVKVSNINDIKKIIIKK